MSVGMATHHSKKGVYAGISVPNLRHLNAAAGNFEGRHAVVRSCLRISLRLN
jgi:hypothetical protein